MECALGRCLDRAALPDPGLRNQETQSLWVGGVCEGEGGGVGLMKGGLLRGYASSAQHRP